MQLHALVEYLALQVRAPIFRHRGRRHVQLALQMKLQATINEHAADLHFGRDFGEFEAGILKFGNRLAERFTLTGVRQRPRQRGISRRQGPYGDGEALLRQFLHQVREPHAGLPQKVLLGHTHVLEKQFRRVLRLHPDLFQTLTLGEARCIGFNQEQTGAFGARLGVGFRHYNDQIGQKSVGDKRFRAVDHILVTVQHGGCFHPLQVRACARLGHRDRGHHLARHQFRQVLELQRFAAVMQDVRRNDVRVQGKTNAGQTQPTDLLDHHGAVKEVSRHAAIFLGQVRAQHPLLPRLVPERTVDVALFFPLSMKRHGLLFEKFTHAATEKFVLGAEQGSRDHAAPAKVGKPGLACRA